MELQSKLIYILDTNFIWTLIDVVKEKKISYEKVLDDIGIYLQDSNSSVLIPSKIKKELQTIHGINKFDHYFKKKRLNDPRWNYFTNGESPEIKEYRRLLQPLFKGNIDLKTKKRKSEEADHELIITAIEIAKRSPDTNLEVISNDHEVIEVIEHLCEHILNLEDSVFPRIAAYPGFHLINNLRMLDSDYKTNIEEIYSLCLEKYQDLRKHQNQLHSVIKWVKIDNQYIINRHKATYPELTKIRLNNRELVKENNKYQEIIKEFEKKNQKDLGQLKSLELLVSIINDIVEKTVPDLFTQEHINQLREASLDKFIDLFQVFTDIYKKKEDKLVQKFFRSWGKVLNGADRYLALEIRKKIYFNVFNSLIDPLESKFKNTDIKASFNLYTQMLPLEIEMDWKNNLDQKLLEKFYSIGLYLSLLNDRLDEFLEIIDILTIANNEGSLENSTLQQFIYFSKLFVDNYKKHNLTKFFIQLLIKNATMCFKAKVWNGVWYILLPLYRHLSSDQKQECKKLIENTFWVTLASPDTLQNMWNTINSEFEIIKGNNIGRSLSLTDINEIKNNQEVPEYLNGQLLVVAKSVGRAHVVVHVPGRHRRLGIQIQDSSIDLHDCLEIQLKNDCIRSFHKCSTQYQDEQRNKLSGILKLRKKPSVSFIKKASQLNITF